MFSGTKTAYAYIVARTRVMKSRLLKPEDYKKMLNMSFDEIVRFLEETEYKKEIDAVAYKYTGPRLLDYALYANLAKTYRKIYQVSFGEVKDLIGEYFARWDLWNIINIIRGKMANVNPEIIEETLVPAGQFSEAELKSMLTKEMGEIVKSLEHTPYYNVLSKIGSIPMYKIEDELYKAYYSKLLKISAERIETKLFLNFIKMEIDIKNVKTLLRLKESGESTEEIIDCIIPGGYELTEDEIRKLASLSYEELLKSLEDYWFSKALEKFESLSEAEVNFDRLWIETIAKRASNYPLSILPVLQYIVLKKVEVDDLRILGWGKWFNFSNEEIEKQMVII
ncbi:MAG: V-type ATP synthase subunit C [Archaeoglobales archaeon]|nr:V-type ATP synthase subunit C [Archaeoglobales archaeon]